MTSLRGKKIVFFANVDWSFLSHRREIAAACVEAGADVSLMAGDTGRLHEIERLGVRAVPIDLSRTGTSVSDESKTLASVVGNLRRLRPDVLHNVSIKPVLYGTLAAKTARPRVLVNAVSGAGSIFDRRGMIGLIRDAACGPLALLTNRPSVYWVFQNEDDVDVYRKRRLIRRNQMILTMGSGVALDRFEPSPPPEENVAVFASRLMWPKGVGVFVEAAELVREKFPDARFVVAGDPDDANASSIGRAQLDEWVSDGAVEWAGVVKDMPQLFASSSVVCLPSWYREGVPKVLLEAAACGRPTIAGDIPGARRAIDNGVNGFLVEPRNHRQLADQLIELFGDRDYARQIGLAARERAVDSFGVESVVDATLGLYRRGLAESDS